MCKHFSKFAQHYWNALLPIKGGDRNLQTRRKKLVSSQWNAKMLDKFIHMINNEVRNTFRPLRPFRDELIENKSLDSIMT